VCEKEEPKMKVAPKPETTSYQIDWKAPTYVELVRYEKSCAEKLAKRVHEAERLQRRSAQSWKNFK